MSLHRLTTVTHRRARTSTRPPPTTTSSASTRGGGDRFATTDGGEQLRARARRRTRRLVELGVGADDADDLAPRRRTARPRSASPSEPRTGTVVAREPGTGVARGRGGRAARAAQPTVAATAYNGPGRLERLTARAPAILRTQPVRPRKLGHVVLGTTDLAASRAVLHRRPRLQGQRRDRRRRRVPALLDRPPQPARAAGAGALPAPHVVAGRRRRRGRPRRRTRCSRAIPSATSGGSAATTSGSNFFWYLKDPAGNFSEYYADMDCIVDDQLWTPGGPGRRARACSAGARRRRRRSSRPTTSPS